MKLCGFAMLGDPDKKVCLQRIEEYLKAGVDMLELGIPFSDATGDGPVIQKASKRAIKSGITPKKCIEIIRKIRGKTTIPIGIMTYGNMVVRYGIEKFYHDVKNAGANSVLVVDIPLEEIAPYKKAATQTKLDQIIIISEYTDAQRLKKIEKIGTGFLYAVSALGVTGTKKKLSNSTKKFLKNIRTKTKMPIMVGFGISKKEHITELKSAGVNGIIIGSKLVKTKTKSLKKSLENFKKWCIIDS